MFSLDRNKFLKFSGTLMSLPLLGPLATFLSGCAGINYIQGVDFKNKTGITLNEFKIQSFVVLENAHFRKPVLIYKKSDAEFTSVSLRCTHKGCELDPSGNKLVCPCHGSEFSFEGKVLNPPAKDDLQKFQTSFDSEYVYVHY
ncbi:MAG: hypothetical protein A3G23_03085 [Bacteroidetes bacterium RIFCSPLOWO2_12_FULL_37_12]|nr:MAG: hypothetical protein A3G23_03085 [Bacteroidetes bacterium RIFCSPLOWO2_12_FULL_37_12]